MVFIIGYKNEILDQYEYKLHAKVETISSIVIQFMYAYPAEKNSKTEL